MESFVRRATLVALLVAACVIPLPARSNPVPSSDGLGNVHFESSCSPGVRASLDRGFALLYSFWYDRALTTFTDVIAHDPNCAIAYWGAAMTFNHPLWGPPTGTNLRDGIDYLHRAAGATERSPREAAYLDAAGTLFGDGTPANKQARDEAYMAKMANAYASFHDDDTALFYALAVEGTYRWSISAQKIELAGKLAEGVHARQPLHPGALHYIIHAYDETGYEGRALAAARQYAASAPAIPHALHMPSHTFLALGLWRESNATNEHSLAIESSTKKASYEQNFHGLWFLSYGYLQTGEAARAKAIAAQSLAAYNDAVAHYHDLDADTADERYDMDEMLSAVLTYGIETGDYSMQPAVSDDGLGRSTIAARMQYLVMQALSTKDLSLARTRCDALLVYSRKESVRARPMLARVVDIAANVSDGEVRLAAGDVSGGLSALARAAHDEAAAGEIVQPLNVLPAQETYGHELLVHAQPAAAQTQLRAALAMTPNRPHAVKWLAEASRASATARLTGTLSRDRVGEST